MHLNFSFFEVLVIIGVAQGFIVSGLIWLTKNRSTSKLLLSFLLIVFNLLCIKILILTTGLWQTRLFRYLPLAFELAIQPLIWLYVSALTRPGFRFRKVHLLHFIPFTLSFAYSLFVYIAVAPEQATAAKDVIAGNLYFNKIKEAEDYLSVVSAIVYWWLGLGLLLRYRRWLNNNVSDTSYPTYAWLRNIAVLIGILIAGLATDILLDYFFYFGIHHFIHWQVFFVYLAVLIYYLGFRGFLLPGKPVTDTKKEPRNRKLPLLQAGYGVPAENKEIRLVEKDQQAKEAILKALEEDELYLDPELNLQKLAKEINSSPAIVSAAINNNFQKNFRNLVNEYRVKKVMQRLKDPGANRFSILGIAYECGFNSEASFYRIFKAEAGMSPKEYIRRFDSPA